MPQLASKKRVLYEDWGSYTDPVSLVTPSRHPAHGQAWEVRGGGDAAEGRATTRVTSEPEQAVEPFATLLGRLSEAHERELQELRSQLSLLRRAERGPATYVNATPAALPHQAYSEAKTLKQEGTPASATQPPPATRTLVPQQLPREALLPHVVAELTDGTAVWLPSLPSLRVHIMGARGLRNADLPILGGTSDPYCVCEVRGKPESRFQTQLLQDTTEPLWDYAEKIEDFGKDDVLIFTVWDHDVFGEDDLLGHAAVTYKELKGVGFEGDLPLLDAGENVKAYLKLRIEVGERGGEGHTFEDLSDVDDFELRPAFRESSQSQMSPKAHRPSLSAISTSSANTDEKSQEIVQFTSKGFMRHLISPPGSPYRLTWDLVGGLLILYDSFAIPLKQVFTMPDSTFTLVMDMITLVFWTVNMVLSTCVGYTKNGVTEMRFSKILWLYLRTWFLVDIVVVVPDWVFTAMDLANTEETGAGDAVRLLRGVRLVRTVRLIRLLKLRWIVAALTELVDSEVISIILDVVKSVTMLLFLNHFVACIWYLISDMQRGRHPTWIESYGFAADSWDYQYFTAFHWSICHFTPASMGVQAYNSAERVYSICVVVGALIGFAYLVGSITNSITQLRSMQEDAKKQFWSLRRYLKQNQVHLSLSIRIQRYLEHAWQRQKSRVSEPKIFGLLSEQLRNELQYAQSVPHMVVHPLFKHLHERSDMTMHRLSAKAVSSRQLACGDELFCPGEIATHVYFVALGQLRYTIASSGDFERVEWVDSTEDWISEPVLWTPSWTHLGCLVAQTHTDLVLVDGSKFEDIISKAPVVHELMTFYARKFMQWISAKKYGELSDIFQGEDVSKTFCDFIPTEA